MSQQTKITLVLTCLTLAFLGLAAAFITGTFAPDRPAPQIVMVDRQFVDTSPVRMNYAALLAADEDTSDFSCNACHRGGERVELQLDELGRIILQEHDYITFRHGHSEDNNHCFNCHDPDQMDRLRTPYQTFSFEESNLLCASCHGSTYRDWENNIHGRTSGYWDLSRGENHRLDCTECHDPHDPGFPHLQPAPAPHSLKNRILLNPENDND